MAMRRGEEIRTVGLLISNTRVWFSVFIVFRKKLHYNINVALYMVYSRDALIPLFPK